MDIIIIDGLSFALPLFIMAIGGIYCEKSGVTMLAVEGLQGFGAFSGALSAVIFTELWSLNSGKVFYLTLLFAGIGGALFSLLHAFLCLKCNANQVISGVVVNIMAMALTAYFTKILNRILFNAASDKLTLTVSRRITVPVVSEIPLLGAVFTDIYPFEIVIVFIALAAWFLLYKMRFGMHLRACGDNPQAVDAAGCNVLRIRLKAILICGELAGLGGMCFAYSVSASFSAGNYIGYGYLAIAAMIFGNWRILPTLGACLLFGFARSGGYRLVQNLQMPSSYQDLVMILPYLLTLLLLVIFSKHNGAPRALGVVYDKGAR